MNPRYPVYIISKGRADTRLTSKALEAMRVPYHIVIEPQEYDDYAAEIDTNKILTLPFSNLGKGSIPARNWIWDHSIERGAKRHWILDDNIRYFNRLNKNEKRHAGSGTIFRCCEDFTERYTNVPISGMNYLMFASARSILPPFYLNVRVYSCLLIKNDLEHRWRGRYNEDTDLCIRVLKSGYCTILFNAFLCAKISTLIMKGGNSDELYKGKNARRRMAQSLVNQHPDITTIVRKWGRWQHQVDYSQFKKNKLIPRPGLKVPRGINNYGMRYIRLSDGKELKEDR